MSRSYQGAAECGFVRWRRGGASCLLPSRPQRVVVQAEQDQRPCREHAEQPSRGRHRATRFEVLTASSSSSPRRTPSVRRLSRVVHDAPPAAARPARQACRRRRARLLCIPTPKPPACNLALVVSAGSETRSRCLHALTLLLVSGGCRVIVPSRSLITY